MSDVDVLPQYLITYLDQKGNRVAYDTAYTSEHRQTGVGRCVHRKGTKNEVKAMEEDVFSKRHSGETRDF